MSESIKFGPDWLRNMSIAGGECRYGREEMLSHFDKAKQQLPEILPRFKNLFVAIAQSPLAMTPDTEDEVTVKHKHVSNFCEFKF